MTSTPVTLPHLAFQKSAACGAKHAILSGDPGRIPLLAKAIDPHAHEIASHRGYLTYLAYYKELPILVSTSAIGGPSMAIVVEELALVGVQEFLRVGTTGAIQPDIQLGDIIIPTGAVRLEGASEDYAPLAYPAVADFTLTHRLIQSAKQQSRPAHVGIVATTSTFYPGQERYDTLSQYCPQRLVGTLREWQKLNVLSYEMETATLFTMTQAMGLRAGAYLVVVVNRARSEAIATEGLHTPGYFAESLLTGYLEQVVHGNL